MFALDFLTEMAYQPLKTQHIKTSPLPVSPNGIMMLSRLTAFEQPSPLLTRQVLITVVKVPFNRPHYYLLLWTLRYFIVSVSIETLAALNIGYSEGKSLRLKADLGRKALTELWDWNLSFSLGQGPFPSGWGGGGRWPLLQETGHTSQEIEARSGLLGCRLDLRVRVVEQSQTNLGVKLGAAPAS